MNRFMVASGFGSLTLLLCSFCCAEMPEDSQFISSAMAANSTAPKVTWHDTMESGWAESRRRKVPMVIFITSGNCQFCDAMKRDTWCDQSISRRLADDFVAIRLTPKQNRSTLNRIKVDTYPTTLIGMPEGKIVDHKLGYQPVMAIHTMLSSVKSRILRR